MLGRTGRPLRELALVDLVDVVEEWVYDVYARFGGWQQAHDAVEHLRARAHRTDPDSPVPPSWWKD